jgi:hypothetical protein
MNVSQVVSGLTVAASAGTLKAVTITLGSYVVSANTYYTLTIYPANPLQ